MAVVVVRMSENDGLLVPYQRLVKTPSLGGEGLQKDQA